MSFRFDKLTIKAQEAVQAAQQEAAERGNPQIDALHLLFALVEETEGIVGPILEKIGANRSQLERVLQAELNHLPKVSGGAQPSMSESLSKVLEAASKQAT